MNMTARNRRWITIVGLALATGVYGVAPAGDLEPPGPPAPTMRIPVRSADLPLTITSAGTYYLAEDITASSGITINANGVTIDLMGYTLTGGSGVGISASSSSHHTVVMNGIVANWSGGGIDLEGWDALVVDVRAQWNGTFGIGSGISVGPFAVVRDCEAIQNGGTGIAAETASLISGCYAIMNNVHGISVGTNSTVVDCTAQNHDFGTGVLAESGSRIHRCSASGNYTGISAGSRSQVVDSAVSGSEEIGIFVNGHGQIRGCSVVQNTVGIQASRSIIHGNCVHDGTTGIYTTGSARVEGNHSESNATGIRCFGGSNVIIKNVSINNSSLDYSCIPDNDVGPIGHARNSTSPWANTETYP